MSYNYPSNKLSVYLSNDGGSDLTFCALFKASLFSKHWIPFCRRFNIEPRSPQAYFSHHSCTIDDHQQWSSIKVRSPWMVPIVYAFMATKAYGLFEVVSWGCTVKLRWNSQRMTLFRRTTSYLFASVDTMARHFCLSETKFEVTNKAVSEDTLKRYEEEILDFGSSSSLMFTIIATLALLNLFGAISRMKRPLVDSVDVERCRHLVLHIVLCVLMVAVNRPVYEAPFVRTDRGCLPFKVLLLSSLLATLACYLSPLIC